MRDLEGKLRELLERNEQLETELGELRFSFSNQELALTISRRQVKESRALGRAAGLEEAAVLVWEFQPRQATFYTLAEAIRALKDAT